MAMRTPKEAAWTYDLLTDALADPAVCERAGSLREGAGGGADPCDRSPREVAGPPSTHRRLGSTHQRCSRS